jgi:ADP-heptose:LPS heptosyltransferase
MRYVEPIGVTGTPGKPVLDPQPGDIEAARDVLESHGVDTRRPDRPRIGIHPGGKWAVKRWPAPAFAALAVTLAEEWNARVVAFTGPGDGAHSERLRENLGGRTDVSFLPLLPIRTVAAALSLLDGFVVSDGGVMHLSVAVGTPTVGIFGSAEPDIWFPYESFGPYTPACVEMECRPCHQHVCPLGHTNCLNELTADFVATRLRGVMTARDGGGE